VFDHFYSKGFNDRFKHFLLSSRLVSCF
jgi:hypothetical protein